MARLTWREIVADDGTNDGWETTNGRWVISSIKHIASGSVEYFFDRCPMLETEEQLDEVVVPELVPARRLVGNTVEEIADAEPVLSVKRDENGEALVAAVRSLVVVRDERPPGSTDIDEMKALVKAYEDSPAAYAEFEGERTARRQQRRGVLLAQRAADQRAADIEAIVQNPDVLDALADALQARGS